MAGLDSDLMALVRNSSREVLQRYVLQHVRVQARGEPPAGFQGRVVYEITDLHGTLIARIPQNVMLAVPAPAEFVASLLLEKVSCTDCGQRLLEGEETICTLCEARQVRELRLLIEQLK